jgi:hypothetical protein
MKRIENKMMVAMLFLFLFSIVMGRIGLVYQGVVFSPRFHGGFWNACKVLFSWEQAKAYYQDPIGIALLLLIIIPALAGFAIMTTASTKK